MHRFLQITLAALVIVGCAFVLGLMIAFTGSLPQSEPFPVLAEESISVEELQNSSSFADALVTALLPNDALSITVQHGTDALRLVTMHKTPWGNGGLPETFSTFADAQNVLRVENFAALWKRIIMNVNDEHAYFMQGMIDERMEKLFGSDISFTYDILPLLKEATTLHVGTNASGSMVVALEGSLQSEAHLKSTLAKLHEGFRSTVIPARIVKRTFDNRFYSTDIRIDESVIEDTVQKQNGKPVHTTTDTISGRRFISIREHNRFIITNDDTMVESIQNGTTVTPPLRPSFHTLLKIADGKTDVSILSTLSKTLLDTDPSILPLQLSGSVLWTLEYGDGATTLTISRE